MIRVWVVPFAGNRSKEERLHVRDAERSTAVLCGWNLPVNHSMKSCCIVCQKRRTFWCTRTNQIVQQQSPVRFVWPKRYKSSQAATLSPSMSPQWFVEVSCQHSWSTLGRCLDTILEVVVDWYAQDLFNKKRSCTIISSRLSKTTTKIVNFLILHLLSLWIDKWINIIFILHLFLMI